MAVSPARSAAFDILLRVERDESYASELLHSERQADLSPRDHGLATELVMGVLRWQALLDQRIASASSQRLDRLDPEVLAALRLGAYQLQFLSRVPARAAIFESVELVKTARKRSAAPFVNAVLRAVSRVEARGLSNEIAASMDSNALARNSSHPPWLVERWTERYGFETARLICEYDQRVPELAIHFYEHTDDDQSQTNSFGAMQTQDARINAELAADGVQTEPGRLLSAARRVVAGDVSATCAFQQGRISIQDEASQLVALLASGGESGDANVAYSMNDRAILDCCAAPGGKTRLLAHRNPRTKVFASELHAHRARLLKSLTRMPNVYVVAADARNLPFNRAFDRILADVPCSGTGTLARNPEIKWRLKMDDLKHFQQRQVAILKSALERLCPGGRLVYATCSLETEENETVIETVLGNAAEFKLLDLRAQLERLQQHGEILPSVDVASLVAGSYLRTLPGVHPCDGFFAAMFVRK